MSTATDQFISTNRARLLDELKDFIRIPSISTLPEHKPDVARAAEFVAAQLRAAGLDHVEIIPTAGHPLVYADSLHAPGKPTVLCYGHYDVQPADPLDLWLSPPFEPTERDGNLYARGAVDDKGQMYMHVKAIEALRAVHGSLPLNVKFLIEGEEEVGGVSVAKYVAENPAKLRADVALVSDTAMYAEGIPTLCIGLRGLIYMEVEASGPSRDLHSGLYGGAAPAPSTASSRSSQKPRTRTASSRFPASTAPSTNPLPPNSKAGAASHFPKLISSPTKSARRHSPANPAALSSNASGPARLSKSTASLGDSPAPAPKPSSPPKPPPR